MKLLYSLLAALLLPLAAVAQVNHSSRWSVAVEPEVGVSLSKMIGAYSGGFFLSHNIGAAVNFERHYSSGDLLLSTGLYQPGVGETAPKDKPLTGVKAYYLLLPMQIGFAKNFTPAVRGSVTFGPYVACGLWGRSYSLTPAKVSAPLFYGSGATHSPFDAGAIGSLNLYIHNIKISMGAVAGLTKVVNASPAYGTNAMLYLTLGHRFSWPIKPNR